MDAPNNGGGYAAMNILHEYGILGKHKSILSDKHLSKEEIIEYVKNIRNEDVSGIGNNKNRLSNEFLKNVLNKNNIKFIEKPNSFYEIKLFGNKFLLKCRTYNGNYTFVTKAEIPELVSNIMIALVAWVNDKPSNLYLIPMSEWKNPKISMLKDRNYIGKPSEPEWGIDINQNNKYQLNQYLAKKLINKYKEQENQKLIQEIEHTNETETEKEILVKARIGHSQLKARIMTRKKKCEICGLSHPKLLIASHIKPWVKSDNHEKLDSENILLLCSMHDALFDKGLISFDENGKILISEELDENHQSLVNINENSYIGIVSKKQKEYLKWHRENIFMD